MLNFPIFAIIISVGFLLVLVMALFAMTKLLKAVHKTHRR